MKNRFVIAVLIAAFLVCGNVWAGPQQISSTSAQTIINNARFMLNEATAAFWTDVELLVWVNNGMFDIATRTKALEDTERILLLTGVTEYAISSNYIRIESAIYSGATTSKSANPYKGLKRVHIRDVKRSDAGEPVQFYTWNDMVGFNPMPGSAVSGYTVLLYMTDVPATVAVGDNIGTPAIYDHALTLFVVWQAFRKERNPNVGAYEADYKSALDRFRVDYTMEKKD